MSDSEFFDDKDDSKKSKEENLKIFEVYSQSHH